MNKTKGKICPICESEFISPEKLSVHIRKYRIESLIALGTRWKPDQDVSVLPRVVELERMHFSPESTGAIPPRSEFKCQFCYNIFKTRNSLNQHLETYHNVKKNKHLGHYFKSKSEKEKPFHNYIRDESKEKVIYIFEFYYYLISNTCSYLV